MACAVNHIIWTFTFLPAAGVYDPDMPPMDITSENPLLASDPYFINSWLDLSSSVLDLFLVCGSAFFSLINLCFLVRCVSFGQFYKLYNYKEEKIKDEVSHIYTV